MKGDQGGRPKIRRRLSRRAESQALRDSEDLAHELLLGSPISGQNGWYHKRQYLKPGSKRESAARAALARLLRDEAPDGYFTQIVASMIDPQTNSPLINQRIKIVRLQGGKRATGRLNIDIAKFIHKRREEQPGITMEAVIYDAAEHFRISERRIKYAWSRFKPVKTNRRI